MSSSRSCSARKERLKLMQKLHNLFEKTVNQLGGPDNDDEDDEDEENGEDRVDSDSDEAAIDGDEAATG